MTYWWLAVALLCPVLCGCDKQGTEGNSADLQEFRKFADDFVAWQAENASRAVRPGGEFKESVVSVDVKHTDSVTHPIVYEVVFDVKGFVDGSLTVEQNHREQYVRQSSIWVLVRGWRTEMKRDNPPTPLGAEVEVPVKDDDLAAEFQRTK